MTAAAEASYFQVHLAMRALARCGSDDPERILVELRDSEYDAPQGRVRINPENNHACLWPCIARFDSPERFQRSGIPVFASSPTRIAWFKVSMTDRPTICNGTNVWTTSIRRPAMAKRIATDEMAAAIINANEVLQYPLKGD